MAATAWAEHRRACIQAPAAKYHLDRSRAVRGAVYGPDGKPVEDSLVRCIRAKSLLLKASNFPPVPELWSDLVEAETRTDSHGRFEFTHLDEGCWTICTSAAGLAPDVQSLVLVQDGSGASLDINLTHPKTLRVVLQGFDKRPRRVYLVPYRWWPELLSRDFVGTEQELMFTEIGGPFAKGLIVVADLDGKSNWLPKFAYNLEQSDEAVVLADDDLAMSSLSVPETTSLLRWKTEISEAERLFFGLLTPVALFCNPESLLRKAANGQHGDSLTLEENRVLRGFGPNAYVPMLIESQSGDAWLEYTSEASEFELKNISNGTYRVRALDSFGRLTFARGAVVNNSPDTELAVRPIAHVLVDEPRSREVMGTVRWEDGSPAVGANVFLQDAASFRRFLQKVDVNRNGFFYVPEVPASRYVAFAMPPDDEQAMKNFVSFDVNELPREKWADLIVSNRRIVGKLPDTRFWQRIELLREGQEDQKTVVWTISPIKNRDFEISNVLAGKYSIRAIGESDASNVISLPFDIAQESSTNVRWPE